MAALRDVGPGAPPLRPWRLLRHGPGPADWNMAMDEALLASVAAGAAPSTIRLYDWDGPAVSVGRFQDVTRGIDLKACASRGVHIVRRPTGGRAILHGGDVTLSIIAPVDALGPAGSRVADSYRVLSEGIALALGGLGVPLSFGGARASGAGGDCFACHTGADLVTGWGEKVVGSAQRRHAGALLQQTSIRYHASTVLPEQVFLGSPAASTYPLRNVAREALEEALAAGLAETLDVTLLPGEVTCSERDAAAALAARWTLRNGPHAG